MAYVTHQRQDDGASSSFKDNGFDTRLAVVSRFLGKYNFVYQMKTNEATKSPAEVYEEATAFMERTRPILREPHRNPNFIWNPPAQRRHEE